MRLAGRRVLITGGASGIGRATAALFRAEGAAVALLDRNEALLAEAVREVAAADGPPWRAWCADVADDARVAAAVAEAAEAHRRARRPRRRRRHRPGRSHSRR